MKRPHKYGAKQTVLDNHKFPSKAEAKRYAELKLLERAKVIEALRLQVRYPLTVNGIAVCTYVADFSYFEKGRYIVEDCKGFRTDLYKLKRKLFAAVMGYEIIETGERSRKAAA